MAQAQSENIDVNKYRNVNALYTIMQFEKNINFKKANVERNKLVDILKKRLSKDEVKELISNTVSFKVRKLSKHDFYEYLFRKTAELSFDINNLKNFQHMLNI